MSLLFGRISTFSQQLSMDRTFPQFRLTKVIKVYMFHMRMRELAAMPEEGEWKVEGRRSKRRRTEGRRREEQEATIGGLNRGIC